MERGSDDSLKEINKQIIKELQKLDEETEKKLSKQTQIQTEQPKNRIKSK